MRPDTDLTDTIVVHHPRSTLSLYEAMLLGSTTSGQLFGGWYDKEKKRLCVLATAIDAIGLLSQIKSGQTLDTRDLWPMLTEIRLGSCPHTGCAIGDGLEGYLIGYIKHLNDDHYWTRPQIAEWLRPIEEDWIAKQQGVTDEQCETYQPTP